MKRYHTSYRKQSVFIKPAHRNGGFICSDRLSPFADTRYFTRIEFRITEMELNAIAPSAMTGWSSAAMASGMAITL